MRNQFRHVGAVLALGLTAGIAVCSSSATAATTAGAHKTAFCAGNLKIDKAGASVNSEAGFLTVLKHNKAALSAMGKNLPSGTVGTDARKEIAAAQKAIASGNVNDLNTVPQSAGWGYRHVLRSRRKRERSACILRDW